jgi:hypothetical protein
MNKAFIALLWMASALLTYWLGLEQGSDSAYPQAENQALPDDNAVIAKKNEGMSQATAKAPPVLSPRAPSVPLEVIAADPNGEEERISETQTSDLQDRIKSSNPVVRLRAFSELLEDGSPQSIEQAKEIYEKLPEGPQRFSELRLLAFSWGQSDPESALEWSSNLDGFDKRIGTGSVLDSWARYDSESAIAWAKENFEGEDNPCLMDVTVAVPRPFLWKGPGRWVRMLRFILRITFRRVRFRILPLGRSPKRLPRMIWAGPSSGLRRWMSQM